MTANRPLLTARPTACCLIAGCLAALFLVGCQAPGYVLDAVLPVSNIPATYEPQDRPTAVFVDDPSGVLPQSPLRGTLAASVEHHLRENKVISAFASNADLERARLNAPGFNSWPIDRIGRHVDAEQVIYIRIDSFRLTDADEPNRPRAEVRVKVVDVETGRLFPPDDYGHAVTTRLFFRHAQDASRGGNALLARELAQRTGEDVARLFYRHKPRAVGSGWDD